MLRPASITMNASYLERELAGKPRPVVTVLETEEKSESHSTRWNATSIPADRAGQD